MYQTVEKNNIFELTEKKSKFIANLFYVDNKNDAENKIKELKKKYYDARHNCYAFRVLEDEVIYEKSSDDGEPSGTAGAPMLNILQKNNLCNVLVVVTRYFGGILLGTGGLVRAYSGATIGSIDNIEKVTIELGAEFEIKVDYSDFQNIQYYFQKKGIRIIAANYEEDITCVIEMNNDTKAIFLKNIANKDINLKNVKQLNKKYIKQST